MQEQLSLFADVAPIRCNECGAELRTLIDLRCRCSVTSGNHLVTSADHGVLYRRTARVSISDTYAHLIRRSEP